MFLQILAIILRKKMEKRMISQSYYADYMRKTEEDLKDMTAMIDSEKEDAEAVSEK